MRLKRLRQQRGLSQVALAKKARVPQQYVSALETGSRKNPGIETLRKLAKALGVSITDLLE